MGWVSQFFIVSILFTSAAFAEGPDTWFTAKGSTEAILDFDATVDFVPRGTPDGAYVLKAIESQVLHLFGPMGAAKTPAVPKTDHQITNVKLKKGEKGSYTASYHYNGTIAVESGPRTRYDIILPIRPGKIYEEGLVQVGSRVTVPCTDPHYQEKSDFWYFWNPNQRGCRLKEGEHYYRVKGAIERLPNQKLTYPEYNRLVDDKGRVRVDIFFGMDDGTHSQDPMKSQDLNAKNFRGFRKTIFAMGFTEKQLSHDEVKTLLGRTVVPQPAIFAYSWQGKNAAIQIRAFYGPTGIWEHSIGYHLLLADALARSSVVIYDGHSGLGSNSDIVEIEKLRKFRLQPATDRYQIYYFNSCSSYPYYLRDFFGRKRTSKDPKGTKNLDILANGLQTPFDETSSSNLVLVRAVQRWAAGYPAPSYQRMAELVAEDTLFGVNGDEDNPSSRP